MYAAANLAWQQTENITMECLLYTRPNISQFQSREICQPKKLM